MQLQKSEKKSFIIENWTSNTKIIVFICGLSISIKGMRVPEHRTCMRLNK